MIMYSTAEVYNSSRLKYWESKYIRIRVESLTHLMVAFPRSFNLLLLFIVSLVNGNPAKAQALNACTIVYFCYLPRVRLGCVFLSLSRDDDFCDGPRNI